MTIIDDDDDNDSLTFFLLFNYNVMKVRITRGLTKVVKSELHLFVLNAMKLNTNILGSNGILCSSF